MPKLEFLDEEKKEEIEEKEKIPPTKIEDQKIAPRIDPEVVALIREGKDREQRLEERLNTLDQKLAEATRKPEEKFDFEDLTKDPGSVIGAIVERQVKSSVDPKLNKLLAFAESMTTQTSYVTLKNKFSAHAQFGPLLKSVEAEVDQLMAAIENPTDTDMIQAITLAHGYKAIGGEKTPKEKEEIAEPVIDVTQPTPPKKKEAETRELTEAERIFMSKSGIKTKEEYFDLVEGEERDLTTFKDFDKKKKEGDK